jgi:hypothetical protein
MCIFPRGAEIELSESDDSNFLPPFDADVLVRSNSSAEVALWVMTVASILKDVESMTKSIGLVGPRNVLT